MRSMSAILGVFCNVIIAPFLMSQSLSLEIDAEIQSKICDVRKEDFSRYYWYEFIATKDGFLIDTMRVRFAIIEDGRNIVLPIAHLPNKYENSDIIKSLGIYNIESGEIENVRCF